MTEMHNGGSIHLLSHTEAYWRVTFDIPPLNIFGPANIPQLEEIVSALETDHRVKVVVFDSAVDGFFLTHYDFLAKLEESTKFPPGPTGLQPLPDMLWRATCDLPAARRRFCRSGRSEQVWFLAAAPWLDFLV